MSDEILTDVAIFFMLPSVLASAVLHSDTLIFASLLTCTNTCRSSNLEQRVPRFAQPRPRNSSDTPTAKSRTSPNKSSSGTESCGSSAAKSSASSSSSSSAKTVNWNESVKVVLFEPLQLSEIIGPELFLEGVVAELCELTGDQRPVELARHLHEAKRDAGTHVIVMSCLDIVVLGRIVGVPRISRLAVQLLQVSMCCRPLGTLSEWSHKSLFFEHVLTHTRMKCTLSEPSHQCVLTDSYLSNCVPRTSACTGSSISRHCSHV